MDEDDDQRRRINSLFKEGDWKTEIQAKGGREQMIQKMLGSFSRYAPSFGPDELQKLTEMIQRFEEMTFAQSSTLYDYIRRICVKDLNLEKFMNKCEDESLQGQATNPTKYSPPTAEIKQNKRKMKHKEEGSRKRKISPNPSIGRKLKANQLSPQLDEGNKVCEVEPSTKQTSQTSSRVEIPFPTCPFISAVYAMESRIGEQERAVEKLQTELRTFQPKPN